MGRQSKDSMQELELVEILRDLIDNFAMTQGENYYWDRAWEKLAEYDIEEAAMPKPAETK